VTVAAEIEAKAKAVVMYEESIIIVCSVLMSKVTTHLAPTVRMLLLFLLCLLVLYKFGALNASTNNFLRHQSDARQGQ
jgi:hypothetical protein